MTGGVGERPLEGALDGAWREGHTASGHTAFKEGSLLRKNNSGRPGR